jgi:hypothetical protein
MFAKKVENCHYVCQKGRKLPLFLPKNGRKLPIFLPKNCQKDTIFSKTLPKITIFLLQIGQN